MPNTWRELRGANSIARSQAEKALAQLREETSAPMIELPLLRGVSGGELVRALAHELAAHPIAKSSRPTVHA